MTREEAIRVIEKDIQIDVKCCTKEQVQEYVEALRMAISALREQESQKAMLVQQYIKVPEKPQWISVKDNLPEPFVSVLVYMPEERPLPPVHEGFLAREGMWYANHFDREPMEITNWMPMPEPPKEEV